MEPSGAENAIDAIASDSMTRGGVACVDPAEVFAIQWPMNRGVIDPKDMYLMEEIWAECFRQLNLNPSDQGALITMPPWVPGE